MYNNFQLKEETKDLNAIVVGSDQVWRPNYTPAIRNYFLEFAKDEQLKIAYAASLGTDKWLFYKKEKLNCKNINDKFKLNTFKEKK